MNLVDDIGMMKTMARGTDFAKELENNQRRCFELEEKSNMAEIRCMMLEHEVEDLKKKNKELEEEITRIKKVVSNEERGKEAVIDLTGDENEKEDLIQLMIENKVLECEKTKAETDLCFWKEKVKQLESRICELESKLKMKGTNEPSIEINDEMLHLDKDNEVKTPKCDIERSETGAKQENHGNVRKRLSFEEDRCSNKKFAPPTPGFTSSGVIDNSDEDIDEDDMDKFTNAKRKRTSNIITSDDDEDDTNDFKRKKSSNIVTSDDESSYDDNAPIITLVKNDYHDDDALISTFIRKEVKEDVSRPLKRLRKLDDITIDLNKRGNSSNEDEEEEKEDDDDESLGDFIVESSESGSELESGSGGDTDSCDESEDGIIDYKETLDKIGRKKDLKSKWDLEGEMLADFGKDPELCMRAVCALYRQQTEDEKAGKATIYHNARGFSQTDAFRGSKLAQFLIDGDSNGDLNKTVEELKRYDMKGVELCRALATKYSKQLFQIYHNKEDPYFLP